MQRNTYTNDGSKGTNMKPNVTQKKATYRPNVEQKVKRRTTATVGGRSVNTNIPSQSQQRNDLSNFARSVARSALSAGIGEAISQRPSYTNESKGMYNVERRLLSNRPSNRASKNSVQVNDGGGFNSQRNAQDRAYANAYRNSMRKKTVKGSQSSK